jgi:Tol biopolymer transport system component
LFFQAQARDRYILRWLHDGTVDDLSFDGNVFHPFATAPAGLIYFELVSHGQSRMMQFDPATKRATALLTATRFPAPHSTASADSHKIVFTSNATGSNQIYLKDSVSGRIKQVTAGNCNNSDPAWDLDGKSIVFTSDCWRAIGLPALYRMSMENVAP